MNRVFEPVQFFPLPDGTRVAPVLNPWDFNARGLPPDALPGASLAVGEIPRGGASKPHLHPLVTQVTWLLEGMLRIRMKGPRDAAPYAIDLAAGQGVLTEPMTFFQLVNPHAAHVARMLYIVTPAYVYLPGENGYDDAVVFEESWEALAAAGFPAARAGSIDAIQARRARALATLGASFRCGGPERP
jgi:hypothetical protein